MNFTEAYAEMKNGKKVRRPFFKGYWYINQEDGKFTIHLENGKEITYGNLGLTAKSCAATDWVIVE